MDAALPLDAAGVLGVLPLLDAAGVAGVGALFGAPVPDVLPEGEV